MYSGDAVDVYRDLRVLKRASANVRGIIERRMLPVLSKRAAGGDRDAGDKRDAQQGRSMRNAAVHNTPVDMDRYDAQQGDAMRRAYILSQTRPAPRGYLEQFGDFARQNADIGVGGMGGLLLGKALGLGGTGQALTAVGGGVLGRIIAKALAQRYNTSYTGSAFDNAPAQLYNTSYTRSAFK
jgi:hypothetical protein